MQIPPILERLLLSNEATFKNASLGLGGQNMLQVPKGKTAVILEVSIEPFCNAATENFQNLMKAGHGTYDFQELQQTMMERVMFQLQIINDNYSTQFSFHDQFEITSSKGTAVENNFFVVNKFKGFREELFIYTDRPMYFNIIYPYLEGATVPIPGLTYTWSDPSSIFTPDIQDLPGIPTGFKNATTLEMTATITTGTSDVFYPVGQQLLPSSGLLGNAETEYFRLPAEVPVFPNNHQSVIHWEANDDGMNTFAELYSLPLINVKYVLINRKASDYGIVKP